MVEATVIVRIHGEIVAQFAVADKGIEPAEGRRRKRQS